MVASLIRLNLIPLIGGVATGTILMLAVALTPAAALDSLVAESGLAGLFAVVAPPIGIAGRVMLAGGSGFGAGAVVWAALFLLFGAGGVLAREGGEDGMPQVRSADAHPDAPPRRPLSAADLSQTGNGDEGPLAPPIPVERAIPADLDQPLAVFDPRAVPTEPLAPVRALPPLATRPGARPAPLAPGERIDSFELSSRHAAESGVLSVEALLARLERGTMLHQRRMSRAA
ncbi:hypothetical protein [uncultured Sphingomonas sp.]|uniref:hypothetical protein n=1 Tax=uncultured Sphingomonas sp. TaxID=158754 RepID=UPI0035CB61A1